MTGIFLLAIVLLWAWTSASLTRLALRHHRSPVWRPIGMTSIFLALLVMPVMDEVIGSFQFRALCKDDNLLQLNGELATGKKIRLVPTASHEIVPGQILKVNHSRTSFRDFETDQEVASYNFYSAKGGWLIRMLHISETDSPLTFHAACAPKLSEHSIAKLYGFSIIN